MKKQSGFTLIELVVAMAVLGLIMGAMVHLFGSSVTSLHVGARQEVVYEEARLLMNELKLRCVMQTVSILRILMIKLQYSAIPVRCGIGIWILVLLMLIIYHMILRWSGLMLGVA